MLVYMPIHRREKKGFYVDKPATTTTVFLFPRWVAIVFDALLYNVDRGQEAQVEKELNFFLHHTSSSGKVWFFGVTSPMHYRCSPRNSENFFCEVAVATMF